MIAFTQTTKRWRLVAENGQACDVAADNFEITATGDVLFWRAGPMGSNKVLVLGVARGVWANFAQTEMMAT